MTDEQIVQAEEQLPKLTVKESDIHGTGVFAAEPIKKGQKIIEYKGEKISSEEGDRRSEMDDKLTYIFILDDEHDIDGSVNGNEAHLINHSCDPNAYSDIIDGKIWILAEKDIAGGEEILYDYALETEEEIECNCGSANCRGLLRDDGSDDK